MPDAAEPYRLQREARRLREKAAEWRGMARTVARVDLKTAADLEVLAVRLEDQAMTIDRPAPKASKR